MSDIEPGLPSQPANGGSRQARQGGTNVRGWRRPLLMAGILAGGIAVGAGGLAMAAAMPGHAGWGHGPRLELIQQFVVRQLDSVGATTAQEAKVHDIIAAAFTDMGQNPMQRDALRKQALDLLRAPAVDRAAAEKLRADQVAGLDALSKRMVGALLDVADQLTPAQRAALADRAESMAQRGPGGGPMGWQGNAPGDGEHGRDPGSDRNPGPDRNPDPGRGPGAGPDRG